MFVCTEGKQLSNDTVILQNKRIIFRLLIPLINKLTNPSQSCPNSISFSLSTIKFVYVALQFVNLGCYYWWETPYCKRCQTEIECAVISIRLPESIVIKETEKIFTFSPTQCMYFLAMSTYINSFIYMSCIISRTLVGVCKFTEFCSK